MAVMDMLFTHSIHKLRIVFLQGLGQPSSHLADVHHPGMPVFHILIGELIHSQSSPPAAGFPGETVNPSYSSWRSVAGLLRPLHRRQALFHGPGLSLEILQIALQSGHALLAADEAALESDPFTLTRGTAAAAALAATAAAVTVAPAMMTAAVVAVMVTAMMTPASVMLTHLFHLLVHAS